VSACRHPLLLSTTSCWVQAEGCILADRGSQPVAESATQRSCLHCCTECILPLPEPPGGNSVQGDCPASGAIASAAAPGVSTLRGSNSEMDLGWVQEDRGTHNVELRYPGGSTASGAGPLAEGQEPQPSRVAPGRLGATSPSSTAHVSPLDPGGTHPFIAGSSVLHVRACANSPGIVPRRTAQRGSMPQPRGQLAPHRVSHSSNTIQILQTGAHGSRRESFLGTLFPTHQASPTSAGKNVDKAEHMQHGSGSMAFQNSTRHLVMSGLIKKVPWVGLPDRHLEGGDGVKNAGNAGDDSHDADAEVRAMLPLQGLQDVLWIRSSGFAMPVGLGTPAALLRTMFAMQDSSHHGVTVSHACPLKLALENSEKCMLQAMYGITAAAPQGARTSAITTTHKPGTTMDDDDNEAVEGDDGDLYGMPASSKGPSLNRRLSARASFLPPAHLFRADILMNRLREFGVMAPEEDEPACVVDETDVMQVSAITLFGA
jgi:hypothetical protein